MSLNVGPTGTGSTESVARQPTPSNYPLSDAFGGRIFEIPNRQVLGKTTK